MQLIRSFKNFPKQFTNSVLTIGNFDGVHRGHKRVIERVNEIAQSKNLNSLVMVFEPTPKEFFMGAKAPARLMCWRDRFLAIQKTGCDGLVQLKFNQAFSQLNADEFVHEILIKAMKIKHLVVGDDFRYGNQRSGNFQHLLECGEKYAFEVEDTKTLMQKSERVSSTAIRSALASGEIEHASNLLGYQYHMSGRVVHGNKLGRELGFPTMNIPIERQISPLHGIYAVRAHGISDSPMQAIASIGTRPAVNGSEWLLEVHILDHTGEHYAQRIDVEFLHFMRPELDFPNLEDLKIQMHKDLKEVREFFRNCPGNPYKLK